MADTDRKLSNGTGRIDFATDPSRYRHWKLSVDGDVATLLMDVDENAPLFEGYQLKLNSYDLGVDIELADALERLRFEHPQVRVILLRSGKPKVFCAGANIRMLAGATHAHKVNFCKFTNETRNAIEDASEFSGQRMICVVSGSCAGGGYELALAADHIILTDDGSSTVSLPELPLLAVLPGTGGLTRITDKRKVRRDHADVFCTTEEGVKGKRAVEWRLVDEVVPNTKLDEMVKERAKEFAAKSDRPKDAKGISLQPLKRKHSADGVEYSAVSVEFSRAGRLATITCVGPTRAAKIRRRYGGAGRGVLAAAACSRTGRRHSRYSPERVRHRGDRVQVGGRSRIRPLLRQIPGSQCQALARPRNRAEMEARAQARRPHLALAGDLDRAGLLLRRHARRADLRGRPLLHADRPAGGRQPPAGDDHARRGEPWQPADEQRPVAAGDAVSRRAAIAGSNAARRPAKSSTPSARQNSASSPSRSTTSTGRTRSASSSRSARASRPTASPAWRRTCASAGRRPWKRKSLPGSPPGRTGSSSAPTPSAKRARCAATAPARRPCSTRRGCEDAACSMRGALPPACGGGLGRGMAACKEPRELRSPTSPASGRVTECGADSLEQ